MLVKALMKRRGRLFGEAVAQAAQLAGTCEAEVLAAYGKAARKSYEYELWAVPLPPIPGTHRRLPPLPPLGSKRGAHEAAE